MQTTRVVCTDFAEVLSLGNHPISLPTLILRLSYIFPLLTQQETIAQSHNAMVSKTLKHTEEELYRTLILAQPFLLLC